MCITLKIPNEDTVFVRLNIRIITVYNRISKVMHISIAF